MVSDETAPQRQMFVDQFGADHVARTAAIVGVLKAHGDDPERVRLAAEKAGCPADIVALGWWYCAWALVIKQMPTAGEGVGK